ncbi:sulfatase family protein [Texcoconibacillus texcoconensis]|uniref:Arylsulfatase A-like enzyme n=1 Tax=Texcoconibacillus texcoconensis TaxID=1095777 RepID=A0A840QR34_9BACI|nr:sulfatase [Texcoconibacillus texcoconensis]MBB5173825.1 arylsulfatase A-like enzyme [Texcoconibacillus texcoconensis]
MNQPNIVFIISHDTGRYLGTYGHKVETPDIDAMAENGVQFNQYYCPAPQCSPSRASVLTGLYPHNNGMLGLAHKHFTIKEGTTTLPKELQNAGYETRLFGLSHETIGEEPQGVTTSGTKLGYDHYQEVPGNRAPKVTDYVEDYLEEKAQNQDKPFFINIGYEETHRPFDEYEDEADDPADVEVLSYLPDTENVRKDLALMNGSTKVFDRAVGRVRRKLEETGLAENTIVILTTDHGLAFPRAKGSLKDSGIETFLIVHSPAMVDKGAVRDQLLCNVDMMPTILDLAGAEIPEGLDGKSFAHLLKGGEEEIRDEFFCELTWHDRFHPMRGVRTHKYKYIRNFEDGPDVYMPYDIHSSLSGQDVREQFYVPNSEEELYDVENDPKEDNNLAADPAYAEVLEDLRGRVDRWMKETNDPILHGPVEGVESTKWAEEAAKGQTYESRNK